MSSMTVFINNIKKELDRISVFPAVRSVVYSFLKKQYMYLYLTFLKNIRIRRMKMSRYNRRTYSRFTDPLEFQYKIRYKLYPFEMLDKLEKRKWPYTCRSISHRSGTDRHHLERIS